MRAEKKGIQDNTYLAWENAGRVVPFTYSGITGKRKVRRWFDEALGQTSAFVLFDPH